MIRRAARGYRMHMSRAPCHYNPPCACAARVIVSLCQSVVTTNGYTGFIYKKRRLSYNCCVQKLWREKQVNKSQLQISTGLPRPRPLALCILKAQEVSHNEGHVSTPACYLLLSVATPCQTLSELLVEYHE